MNDSRNRLDGRVVSRSANAVLTDWFEYDYPFGPDGPQFRIRKQDDGTWEYTSVDYMSTEVHPDDVGSVRFELTITARRVEERRDDR